MLATKNVKTKQLAYLKIILFAFFQKKTTYKLAKFVKLSPNFFNRDLLEISSHFEDKLKKLELPEGTVYLLLNNQEDGREAFSWGWIFIKRKVTMFLPVFCLINITEKLNKWLPQLVYPWKLTTNLLKPRSQIRPLIFYYFPSLLLADQWY